MLFAPGILPLFDAFNFVSFGATGGRKIALVEQEEGGETVGIPGTWNVLRGPLIGEVWRKAIRQVLKLFALKR